MLQEIIVLLVPISIPVGLLSIFFIVRWHNSRILKAWNELSWTWTICPECGELIYPHHLRCPCGHEQTVKPDFFDDGANVPEINPCSNCCPEDCRQNCRVISVPGKHSRCERGLPIYDGEKSGWTFYNRVATCTRCGSSVGRYAGTFQEVLIPLLGATGVGKSAYLSALTSQLEQQFGNRLTLPFPNPTADENRKLFAKGRSPVKTKRPDENERQPSGFTVDIRVTNKKQRIQGMRLFFYDPAGEVYNVGDNYAFLHCLDLMDGAVIFVDPLAIPEIHNKYTEQLKQANAKNFRIGRDTRDVVQYLKEEIYQRTYRDYEYEKRNSNSDVHFYLDGTKKEETECHYARCAVVITKSDVFDLDDLFGESAIQKERRNHPSLSYEDAMNAVCRRLLQETWGSELQFIDEIFADVRCFSVSSFGRMPGSGSFAPQRVECPLLWLLQSKYANNLGKIK